MILNKKYKIGILTSSRADYGIYKNLLKTFLSVENINLSIIVFGMHLQKQHGKTIKEIINDKYYNTIYKVKGMPVGDSKLDISNGYGEIVKSFSIFWNKNKFNLIFALGDRFEMCAAVQAGIPYELKFAHIHGGEISLGSIDNIYRDQISLSSDLHFTSNIEASKRLKKLLYKDNHIYNVGSLSIDSIDFDVIPSWRNVCKKFNIPNKSYILITFHPETVGVDENIKHVKVLYKALIKLSKNIHLIITHPNADSLGILYRNMNFKLQKENPENISIIESFGQLNYFSAIKNSKFLLGNTSSGIIEAASFGKYVLNVGKRQNGRIRNENIIDCNIDFHEIIEKSSKLFKMTKYNGFNIYKKNNTKTKILTKVLNYLNNGK